MSISSMRSLGRALLVAGSLAVLCSLSQAGHVAASFALPQPAFSGSLVAGMDGFRFRPTADITVSELGWYDHGADGLVGSHQIGLWAVSGATLLGTTTVTTSSALDATTSFRFEDLATDVLLLAGQDYVVAGFAAAPFDPYVFLSTSAVAYGAEVGFTNGVSVAAGAFGFTTASTGSFTFFGANFRYELTSASVPEPGSIGLIAVALLAAACKTRRRVNATA